MRAVLFLLLLVACSGTSTAPGSPSSSAPAPARSGPTAVGDRIAPIAGPIAIPVKGAKLTMVNYFATWCPSSKQWMPHIEDLRKKHAGLAVIAVANYDETSSQADLEAFGKE